MRETCVFCDLDESQILFRDDLVLAIWDQYPVNKGHLLIVAMRHVADWFDATLQEQQAFLAALNRGRDLIIKQHGATAFNIGVNVGTAAGQTVPHLHMHLIPRFDGDMSDPRGGVRHVIPSRGNYLSVPASGQHLLQGPSQPSLLIRGEDDPLLPHFTTALDDATNADFAVAFVMTKGVDLLRGHLYDLLQRGGRVRIVTGDYMDATDPDALVQLLDLSGDLQLRVFESRSRAFHPKAYIFHNGDGKGTAFVGSSNLTGSALEGGVEWNYRVLRENADCGFADVENAFEDLFAQARLVDQDWIDDYRRRRRPASSQRIVEVVDEPILDPPKPHSVQQEALAALEATREEGNEAGLVVLATGLGKTWLAAFDSSRNEFPRVLFVAHREEILNQAMRTFRRIRPYAKLGLYSGKEKSRDADVVFASIQTLGRMDHLRAFPRDRFDYIVIDEFHHAAARTYRQLLDYFTPHFLLGLTATPERMDGGDLLALCQENLVYRKDVVAGIEAGLLCPFQYFGVPDEVDYTNIPWRSSRFDEEELTKAVATTRRAGNALEQFRERGGDRGLGFCCSQLHANFMAEYFNENGVRSVAVHSGAGSSPRATALEALEAGRLDIVFAVDMFNEGLDVPNIDTILMLRPTESSVIWLQQFGRGLRRAEGKSELKVIDYIGNHRTFLVKVRSLLKPILGSGESDAEISAAMRLVQQGKADLPEGCNITYDLEAMDIIRSLLRTRSADDAILAFYDDFRERNGTRPTAVELYHSGYNPRSLRKTHGSWTEFLRTMGDLSDAERQAVDSAGEVLGVLESTPMTKSFKMLTLQAMLNHDALPGRLEISDLTREFQRIARRTKILRDDVGDALEHDSRMKSLLEKNPIEAWCGGKGTAGTTYFEYDGTEFSTKFTLPVACRGEFQDLARELIDWRLAEYQERGQTASTPRIVCRLLHSGGRPIIKLPDRRKTAGIPLGWYDVVINDKPHVANFVKEFINVVRTERESDENVLPAIAHDWFGPDAGRPGTRFEVSFEPAGDALRMEPVGSTTTAVKAQPWSHYMREDIPPLFGLEFNPSRWNQGFVASEDDVCLLVTLEKSGLNKDHRYEDRFLSPQRFAWQSQNRTSQEGKHGQLIRDHEAKGVKVHLFVRRVKVLDGKAAPFIYCGQVNFVDWEGEKPISVTWDLQDEVPVSLRGTLRVPDAPN